MMNFPDGIYTVLVTPFDDKNNIDFDALNKWIEYQCNSPVSGIVLLGTTSESPTLIREEQFQLVKYIWEYTDKRKFVVAGVGGNNTEETLEFAKKCVGYCDGFMVTVPSYNKPTQAGIIEHYKYISQNREIDEYPVMIYNIPSRTGVNMNPDTIKEVVKQCPNIVAIKEASGSIDQLISIKSKIPEIKIFSGDDKLILDFCLAHNCNGLISVASNVIPHQLSDIYNCCNKYKDKASDKYYNYNIPEICNALFYETNPTPIKYILYKIGIYPNYKMRLPLLEITEECKKLVNKAFENTFK